MDSYSDKKFTGERALFGSNNLTICNSVFTDGESPLKECRDIELQECIFGWKYPLWYCSDIYAHNCTWLDMARAGIWYSDNINISDSVIQAPKLFRRCRGIRLSSVFLSDARETLWSCSDVKLSSVTAKGDYFAMNSDNIDIDGLVLDGNYSFDGGSNITIRNSRLISKDAFWNSSNITVYDSFISGEYLGWNSHKLTFINCTIESLQGLCYVDNLVMKNCRLTDTTLAFEYSTVDADIDGRVESILNPLGGTITAAHIGELIIEKDEVDPGRTTIICKSIGKKSEYPEWRQHDGI